MPWASVESAARDRDPLTARVEAAVDLRPGMRVADIGAGAGYFAFRFARVVGASGRVIATDVDGVMVERMEAARDARNVAQLEILEVDGDDPALAPSSVDRILMANSVTFAECPHDPRRYLRACHAALREGGRLIVYRGRRHTRDWTPPYGSPPECDEPDAEAIIEMGRALFRPTSNEALEAPSDLPRGEHSGFLLVLERR